MPSPFKTIVRPRERDLGAFDEKQQLVQTLQELQQSMQPSQNIHAIVQKYFRVYSQNKDSKYCLSLMAHNTEELIKEIDYAFKGLERSFEKDVDWQTPMGSYFTPDPVGTQGSVSFVYPGGFNSYIGVGKDIFRLFPKVYEQMELLAPDMSFIMHEKMIYPRSVQRLDDKQIEELETRLVSNPVAMLSSGTSLSILFTFILRDIFGLTPASSFGYSLGENSMMFATGIWMNGDEVAHSLEKLKIFKSRLAGPQNAVREYWSMPSKDHKNQDDDLWHNYLLMVSVDRLLPLLQDEPKVYLTHINTPRQIVIGGDPASCQRIINTLKCTYIQAPFNYALHCRAVQSEYLPLHDLHDWPVQNVPDMKLYSAADYSTMQFEQEEIAQKLAEMLVHSLDFPKLVNRVYQDGGRVFIELGAGANCARWVSENLKGVPHVALSINRKGADDLTSILRLLARLCSHRVPMNLDPLFLPVDSTGYTQADHLTYIPVKKYCSLMRRINDR